MTPQLSNQLGEKKMTPQEPDSSDPLAKTLDRKKALITEKSCPEGQIQHSKSTKSQANASGLIH